MSAHEVALLSLEEIRTGRNPWPLITETKRCRSRWDWAGACGSCTPMHHSNDGSGGAAIVWDFAEAARSYWLALARHGWVD